jgi:ABC-2 type transport system ATP-binding protein
MTELAIEVTNFKKKFFLVELERLLTTEPGKVVRNIEAVRDISIRVEHGQVYGFLGPNGAGKTTTIKACMDLIRPTSGTIRLYGREPGDPAVKQRIGYLPEQPYFYDYLKPQEILDFFGRLFGIERRERKKRIDMLIDRVGLGHARNRALRKFSKGMLQRLGIAQALLNDPDLLVLDEPMSGLDPMGRHDIRDLIIEERKKGKTVFFSTHILSDVEYLCDRVAIVVGGVVRREGLLIDMLSGEKSQVEIIVRGAPESLEPVLHALGATTDRLGETLKVLIDSAKNNEAIAACLAVNARVDRVHPQRDTLEAIFVREAAEARALGER